MAQSTQLVVKIVSDTKQAVAGVDGIGSKIGGLGKKAGAAAAGGVVALGAGIAAMAVSGVKDAANLEQSIGAIDSVFKGNADQIHAWSKTAATDVGLTRNEFNELGTLIGAQLKNGGTAMDELAPKTNNLIGLGADLSSMFGGSTKDAVGALSSALKGERDPIEKYGVSLSQAKVDAEAAALGFKKVDGALSAEASQAATLSLIMKQTADAHGNFAKEGDTLAHQQQVLSATFTDLKTQLGTALLPIINKAFTFLNETAVPAVKALFGAFQGGDGGGLGSVIERMGLDGLITSLQGVGTTIITAVQTHWPQLQAALAIVAPQVMAVVRALIGLYTAIATQIQPAIATLAPYIATVFGVIANIVGAAMGVISAIIRTITALISGDWAGAWQGIKDTLAAAWNLITTIVGAAIGLVQAQLSALGSAIMSILSKAWNSAVETVKGAWSDIKTSTNAGVDNVRDYIAAMPGKILSALGNLGGLLKGAGTEIMNGFLGGLREKYEDVKNFVGGIASWIADHKGPLSYDRRLLQPAGQAIMTGFVKSLRAGMPELRSTIGDVTDIAAGVGVPTFAPPNFARATARHGAGNTYITIQGAVDPVGTARQVAGLLRSDRVRTGRVVLAGGPR